MSGSWRSASCGSAIRTTSRTCAAPTSVPQPSHIPGLEPPAFAQGTRGRVDPDSFCCAVQAREFIDISARIPSTAVSPRRSYLGASSSFRGTHMCRELQVEIDAERLKSAGALLN